MQAYLRISGIAFCLLSGPTHAVTPVEQPGFWRPWQTAALQADALNCAAKQEYAVVEAQLRKLRTLWEQIPAIASPVGYEVRAEMHSFRDYCLTLIRKEKSTNSERRYERSRPIVAEMSFFAFDYLNERGKLMPNDETQGLYFRANLIKSGPSLPYLNTVFLEPVRLNDRYGMATFGFCNAPGSCSIDDDYLLVRNNDRQLWRPAKLVGIYDQFLVQAKEDIQGFESEAEKARRAYDDYLTPKAATLREEKRRQFAPAMARSQKKTEAEIIASLEDNARKAEANYRRTAEDAAPKPGSVWASILDDIARIEKLRSQVIDSRPDANAYLCGKPWGTGRQINRYGDANLYRPEGGSGCHPVVTENPDYFDKKLPKTAIQLLSVDQYSRCFANPRQGRPGGCTENLKLLRGLDWQAVKGFLDR